MATYQDLERAVEEYAEAFEEMASASMRVATVLEKDGKELHIAMGSDRFVVTNREKLNIAVGDTVAISGKSGQIVKRVGRATPSLSGKVLEITDSGAVIEIRGEQRIVNADGIELRVGDIALLDASANLVLGVKQAAKPKFEAVTEVITWDDVRGQVEAKRALREALELPYLHPEVFKHYNMKPTKGIMLYGPPGCGKTMLGQAAATSMGAEGGFILCKGPEVLDPYVGAAEATIRSLFARARQFYANTGKRATIFIDEADAILGGRGARNAHMEKTVVPQFLAEMDGVEDSCATVILATNRSLSLDAAVVRPGRIDRKIEVTRPNAEDSFDIAHSYLSKAPVSGSVEELAMATTELVFKKTFINAAQERRLSDHVSGSLICSVVELAKGRALNRDLSAGSLTGLTLEDLSYGVEQSANELSAVALENYN